MKSTEAELAELKERVARLEARLDGLAGTVPGAAGAKPVAVSAKANPATAPGLAPPPAAPVGEEPPLVTTPPPPSAAVRRTEINSSVWIAGAGAVIFLVGAFYGLTVAIQRGWISPLMRVAAGLAAGGAIAVWASRLLRDRRGMGVALLAVGAGLWTFSLYYGSRLAELFPSFYGLAGTVFAVAACGWLAARAASDGALAVSLATGLIAPLIFSSRAQEFTALMGYLIALGSAQFAVHFLGRSGERWKWSRLLGTAGLWSVALLGTVGLRHSNPGTVLALVPVLAAVGLAVVWLPGMVDRPWAPGFGSVVNLVGAAGVAAIGWDWMGLAREGFAAVLVAFGLASAALVFVARWRTAGQEHDRGLILLAIAFALVAAPVAWEWRWVSIAWGVGGLALAWAGRKAGDGGGPRVEALATAAALVAGAASGLWLVQAIDQGPADALFLNRVFVGGMLAAGAWAVMASEAGGARGLAFLMLQIVAVNAIAWELARGVPSVEAEEATLALGKVLATLTYAVAGAAQWLRGVRADGAEGSRSLRLAGYAWLAVAAGKLMLHDLAGRDVVYKAVAALAVGAIFLGAALWANKRR